MEPITKTYITTVELTVTAENRTTAREILNNALNSTPELEATYPKIVQIFEYTELTTT